MRLILPNGRSIVLERQPGADTAGNAGLEDEIDNRWEIGSGGNDNDIIRALRRGTGDTINQSGQKVVRRNLNIAVAYDKVGFSSRDDRQS